MSLVFDIEADGLLDTVSMIHCVVIYDTVTEELLKFSPSFVSEALDKLMSADHIIGHNIIGYDIPALQKVYPWFEIDYAKVTDTLVLSRLIHANLSDQDVKEGKLEGKSIGSHSLDAWGRRLGFHKAAYAGGWESYSPEMMDYCARDVEVTVRLYEKLSKANVSKKASDIEHEVARIVAQQERRGITFDGPAANKLVSVLMKRRIEIESQLQDMFPAQTVYEEFIPKKDNKKRGYVKGVPFIKSRTVPFNPGSRQQIADRLIEKHGWKPSAFTETGQPKIDEKVLGSLKYPEAKTLAEYFIVQKLLGYLGEGEKAWLKYQRQGKIYAEVITNGAVTGRATHRNPNLAQVPAVGAPFGKECRSLFRPSAGLKMVGIDVSGLELRMLAHYMSRHDNGAYGKEVVEGDVHTANQNAAGLETRNQAKTFIYAFLYGAGDEKIGSIVGKGKKHGRQLKARFLERTPALGRLVNDVRQRSQRGYLLGLDGRHLHVRSSHAALNTLLQSAGAIVCKVWMIEVDKMITQMQWHDKVAQLLWIHDELQFEASPDIAEEFGKKAVECIVKTQEILGIKIPLTGEYKVGNNWAETH